MFVSGYNVVSGYLVFWNGIFGEVYYIGEMIWQIMFYILFGLVVVFVFWIGLFNIGVEGQFFVGWIVVVWVGIFFDVFVYIYFLFVLLVAAVVGGIWGLIFGFLKVCFFVYEVIVMIMMNYIVFYLINYFIFDVMIDYWDKIGKIYESVLFCLLFLEQLIDYFCFYWGILIVFFMVVFMWFIIYKIKSGFEFWVVGFNQYVV